MSKEGFKKPSRERRSARSEVLSKKQFGLILTLAALQAGLMAILFWRGFPVGDTFFPIIIGLFWVILPCYNIKCGFFSWRDGGKIYRNERPFEFWFSVTIFLMIGLLMVAFGLVRFISIL